VNIQTRNEKELLSLGRLRRICWWRFLA